MRSATVEREYRVVDAFADADHLGNPAAVLEVPELPHGAVMQAAAHHIGLPTTAFVTSLGPGTAYGIRWFTPHAEINLCGHATIASARHLFAQPRHRGTDRLTFRSPNGVLHTERDGDSTDGLIGIDVPAAPVVEMPAPAGLLAALGVARAVGCHVSTDDVLVELPDADAVATLRPDFSALAGQPYRGHVVTALDAAGDGFVSRTFFPALGVDEDQVCVTAHAKLAPFWARRLGRTRLTARQLSHRGGRLEVQDAGERVRVLGTAVPRPGIATIPWPEIPSASQ